MRVLLIKLSSMGDIIHTLPAITDAVKANPALRFTWVVEDAFQEIPRWHTAVEEVITLPLRKRNWPQIWRALRQIRATNYDLVIDAQGLLKSAIIAKYARTKRSAGFDWQSAREALASIFYKHKYAVEREQHAVDRLRQLFAQIFNYQITDGLDYGIAWQGLTHGKTNNKPYLVFLHGTTWASKHWPDEYWVQLANLVAEHGFNVQVTWANAPQKARAQMLAQRCANVIMLPHLTLQQALNVLQHAHGVVAVDTGFAHLSAALDKPIVAIYGPTPVLKSGAKGNYSINLAAQFACAPCGMRECTYKGVAAVSPACFQRITPAMVWQKLVQLLQKHGQFATRELVY